MARVELTARDIDSLLSQFVGTSCAVREGKLTCGDENWSLEATVLELRAAVTARVHGLQLNAHTVMVHGDGAVVDFEIA